MTTTNTRGGWTAGPWTAGPSTRYRGDIGMAFDIATREATWDPHDAGADGMRGEWQYPDGYERIATTSDAGNARANARLIAAAPELADALALFLEEHEEGNWIWNTRADGAPQSIKAMRAALARARGEAVQS